MKLLLSLLTLIFGTQTVINQLLEDRIKNIRRYVNECIADGDSPGLQYVVVSKDSILFSIASGKSDILNNRPMEEKTSMMIYSMTKTITAAAVLQLVDCGLISLDIPVQKYLLNFPYGEKITVRHLLAQMSGIPNPIPLSWVHLVDEHSSYNEFATFNFVVKENMKLKFLPGENYGYSNISYWLLGQLIETVSGVKYVEYVCKNIFDKLNIPDDEMDFVIPIRKNHSKGYLPKWSFMNIVKSFVIDSKYIGNYEDGWLHIHEHYLNGPPFGGIVATACAVAIFLQDQLKDSSVLFSRKIQEQFYEQQKKNDGEQIKMSLGWHIEKLHDQSFYFKEGGGGGFHSEMRIYREQKIATVVISNNTTFDVKGFLNNTDRYFIHKD